MDLYIGGKLKLEGTVMVRSGNALQFTGKETKGTPPSMLGFNLEDTITVGATPRDPADVTRPWSSCSEWCRRTKRGTPKGDPCIARISMRACRRFRSWP